MELKNLLAKIVLFPVALLVSVFCFIGVIFLIPAGYIPFTVYKILISLVSSRVFPGSKLLVGEDSMISMANIYKEREMYVQSQLNFEGRVNFEDFVEICDKRVMKKELSSGAQKFPELQCYIDTFMGYFIRIPDKSFDLQNHIQLHKDPMNCVIDRRELDKIVKNFFSSLFPVKRSPWQILLVNNYKMVEASDQEHSVVIIKFHHCLADGYAAVILLMWEALLQQNLQTFAKPKLGILAKGGLYKKLIATIGVILQGFKMTMALPLYFVLDRKKLFDENEWHNPQKNSDHARCTMRPIETSLVKEISAENKVTITTVILAAVTGGFRRMMEDNGLKSPKSIRMTHSLPLPNHPDALTNHSALTFFTHKLSSPESELTDKKLLHHNERELKLALRPALLGMPIISFFLDSYPLAWIPHSVAHSGSFSVTAFCGTIPIPQPLNEDVEFLGSRLVGCYASIDASTSNICATVFLMKYKKHFFINYGIQNHLLKDKDDIYKIDKYVNEELVHLRSLPMTEKNHLTSKSFENPINVNDSIIRDEGIKK